MIIHRKTKQMKQKLHIAALLLLAISTAGAAKADDGIKNEFNPITTGVTSLSITPDARGASKIGRAHV